MGVKKFAYCLNSHGELILDYLDGETKGLSVKDTMIGDKLLRIPRKYLAPGSDRRGELMIDSGLGYMTRTVFNIVAAELKKQMSNYKRVIELEAATRLTLCYNFTSENSTKIPDLTYRFSSGSSTCGGAGKELFCLPAPTFVEFDLKNESLGFRQQTF
ncbi:hypothetical protein PVL29_010476 [Vitis rotundifolia]|uniref:Xylanase inhibitor C-terminal domain-containing protein n=1 Tax=Vitis rotundifolia TaxID=103349 RepID=A0AA39DUX3_VITRO|nr:hypothetical protein PVL29_010476 [Vitis rotundifolia]